MSKNIKFGLILLIFFIVPNLLAYIPTYKENHVTGYYVSDHVSFVVFAILFSLSGPIIILLWNIYSKDKRSIGWIIFSVVLFFATLLYFYATYSITKITF